MKCIDERCAEGEAHGTGARWRVGYHLTFRVIRNSTGKLPQLTVAEAVGPWGRGLRKRLIYMGCPVLPGGADAVQRPVLSVTFCSY